MKDANWKRGVLFACISLRNMSITNNNKDDISWIIGQAGIEKKEIKSLLKDYEKKETIAEILNSLI